MADTTPQGSTPSTPASPDNAPKSEPGKIDLSIQAPSAPAAAPSMPPAPAPPPEKKEGMSFTNIFNREKAKKKETKVITSVLKKNGAPTAKPILGAAPELQKSIEEGKKAKLKKKLRLVQVVFLIVFLAGAGSALYFYSELAPGFDVFGPNTTQKLTDVNQNLRSVQTQISKYRYLAAQLDLNRFSHVSGNFLDRTAQLTDATGGQAATLTQAIAQAANDLPILLSNIREQLTPDLVVPTTRSEAEEEQTSEEMTKQAQDDLRNALLADRREIARSSTLTPANEQDIKLIDNTVKIVGNTALISTVRGASVDRFQADLDNYVTNLDSEARKVLTDFMGSVLASTKSDIATIGSIKANRIDWSTIIKQIEDVTRTVDPTFGAGLTQTLGDGIFYTGYDFDTTTNKIVLSGVTRTTSADNFTLISDLIDTLELSPNFQSVEMRSFSKSGSFDLGFTSTFKIDLALEVNGATGGNPVALAGRAIARATGIKRTQ